MGNCVSCVNVTNFEQIIIDFFDQMAIVNVKTEVIRDLLLNNITNNLLAKSHDLFKENILSFLQSTSSNEKFIPITIEFWDITYNSLIQNHKNLGLTLIMMSKGEANTKVQSFYELSEKFGSKGIRKDLEENSIYFQIDLMREFISFYIFFLTIYSLNQVAKLSDDKDHFKINLEEIYNLEFRRILENNFLKDYKTEINLNTFFSKHIQDFSQVKIRETLYSISIKK